MDLGYVVHTPAELFGTREAALGASDELWLEKVRLSLLSIEADEVGAKQRSPQFVEAARLNLHGEQLAPQARFLPLVTTPDRGKVRRREKCHQP